MMLQVRVPVLSENIYSIYPSSSLIEELKVLEYSPSGLRISTSLSMKKDYVNLTISRDMIREIGIMVLSKINTVKKVRIPSRTPLYLCKMK